MLHAGYNRISFDCRYGVAMQNRAVRIFLGTYDYRYGNSDNRPGIAEMEMSTYIGRAFW